MLDEIYLLRGLVLRGKTEAEAKATVDGLVKSAGGSFTIAFNQLTRSWTMGDKKGKSRASKNKKA